VTVLAGQILTGVSGSVDGKPVPPRIFASSRTRLTGDFQRKTGRPPSGAADEQTPLQIERDTVCARLRNVVAMAARDRAIREFRIVATGDDPDRATAEISHGGNGFSGPAYQMALVENARKLALSTKLDRAVEEIIARGDRVFRTHLPHWDESARGSQYTIAVAEEKYLKTTNRGVVDAAACSITDCAQRRFTHRRLSSVRSERRRGWLVEVRCGCRRNENYCHDVVPFAAAIVGTGGAVR